MEKQTYSINYTLSIPISCQPAFDTFTRELNLWWPKEYTWGGDVLESIEIEPMENGRCFERGPHGFECDWGRVLTWEPPHRLLFTWQINADRVPEPNPDKSSEIEVLFKGKEEQTLIDFEHRKLENHGKNAKAYKEALNSSQGWLYILECFKSYVT